ncbi:MAG: CBU_0592 family membrane protein [Pikeienuella sp.]
MPTDFSFADVLGIIGSLTICSAYFAVSTGRMNAERAAYQWMNACGSVLLLISLYFRPNPGAILIEVLWFAIAAWSLGRIWMRRRH